MLVAVFSAGCGGGDSSEDAAAESQGEPGFRATRPQIETPVGLPPKKLIIKDMETGTGREAEKGDRVKIQYFGIDWRGSEHANSWRYETLPVFTLGKRQLLRGLNLAAAGMKEGGSREVIIPHNLVYYPGGNHRQLGPLDALVYKVYLVDVLETRKG